MIALAQINKAFRESMYGEMHARKLRLVLRTDNKILSIAEFIDEDAALANGNLRAYIVNAIKNDLPLATSFTLAATD